MEKVFEGLSSGLLSPLKIVVLTLLRKVRLISGGLLVLYVVYYYVSLRRKPRLLYLRTERNERLVKGCPSLFRPYSPPLFFVNAHVQLVVHSLRRRFLSMKWHRELLKLQDGGSVTLDWAHDPSDLDEEGKPTVHEKKTLVVLHGLAGGSEDFGELAKKGIEAGFRVIVYNRRGHSDSQLTSKKLTSFGNTSDLKEVLQYLTEKLPESPLFAVGVSAGSGVLVSYLGEVGDDSPLKGAVGVSPGYDIVELLLGTQNLARSDDGIRKRLGIEFDSRIHSFYDFYMMGSMRKFLKRHIDHFEDIVSWKEIEECKYFSEYEAKHAWRICGFDSFETYLKEQNPMRAIRNVKVPTLMLNALDDPICKRDLIFYDIFTENEAGILVTTDFGSHTTFLTGLFSLSSWKDDLIFEYLQSVYNNAELFVKKSKE